ncbi:MAG: hypothetical protein LBC19_14020 [Tannerella sp.]|jgi:hypothetical protein|nr:hypothetical protein [Tannerella sp.]
MKTGRIVIFLIFICCLSIISMAQTPNLVPGHVSRSPNYWCTWYAQNYWVQRGGEITDFNKITNSAAREELTHDHIFNERDGWAVRYLPRGRNDWFFLIDHGWQTKDEKERIPGAEPFFSLQIDVRDFHPYGNIEPQESLRLFNEEIRNSGWRGLGIWVRGNVSAENAEKFVKWSKYAGIKYWKIDGGDTQDFHAFKAKEQYFPELTLEYVTGAGGNINPDWDISDKKEYPSVYDIGGVAQEFMLQVLQHSDVFRTYDASPILMTTTTLRRTHDILKQTKNNPAYRSILNLQDDCNVAAGLGCLVASKRHPNFGERLYKGKDLHHQLSGKRHMQNRMNEPERFGRWSRIAPAFAAGNGDYLYSTEELIDYYPYTEYDTWATATYGKVVYQSAPAVMARNMPLPKVEVEGEAPYVMATTYPNGPVCIATEGRVRPENQWFYPKAIVTVQVKDVTRPIGIFGYYDMLIIEFAQSVEEIKYLWAQDLLAESSADIKELVKITGNVLMIPGMVIEKTGTSAGDPGDQSVPGLVIQLAK